MTKTQLNLTYLNLINFKFLLIENAISAWGLFWERVLLKHSCILSIARVPKALVLLTVCTCAWAKPFPKIVPMVKLHSLAVATCKNSDSVLLKITRKNQIMKFFVIYHGEMVWCKGFFHSRLVTWPIHHGEMVLCKGFFNSRLVTWPIHHDEMVLCKGFFHSGSFHHDG